MNFFVWIGPPRAPNLALYDNYFWKPLSGQQHDHQQQSRPKPHSTGAAPQPAPPQYSRNPQDLLVSRGRSRKDHVLAVAANADDDDDLSSSSSMASISEQRSRALTASPVSRSATIRWVDVKANEVGSTWLDQNSLSMSGWLQLGRWTGVPNVTVFNRLEKKVLKNWTRKWLVSSVLIISFL